MLFLHAGIGPSAVNLSIREINERIRAEILGQIKIQGISNSRATMVPRTIDEEAETKHLEELLKKHDVKKLSSTYAKPRSNTPRFGSQVLMIREYQVLWRP